MTTSIPLRVVESDSAKQARLRYRNTQKHEDTWRNSKYLREYGITLAAYNEMLESQNYTCKICHCPETAVSNNYKHIKRLAVDHCHSSGVVRGLLCDRCNHMLGLVKDSIELLESAKNYLRN